MKRSESIVELAKSLSKFQKEVNQPMKDKTNPHFRSKFVGLEGVVQAITETAGKHGLSFIQIPINEEDRVGIITVIMHDSGEYIESEPLFMKPMKQDPQAYGACLTYAKRYSLSAMFGITSDEDTDAEDAMDRSNTQKQNYNNNQTTSQTTQNAPQSNLISDAQIKMLKTKLGIVSKKHGADMIVVYNGALQKCNIQPTETKDLTKQQASTIINYLQTLE